MSAPANGRRRGAAGGDRAGRRVAAGPDARPAAMPPERAVRAGAGPTGAGLAGPDPADISAHREGVRLALAAANAVHRRVATVAEVTATLRAEDRRALERGDARDLSTAVSKHLSALVQSGQAFSPGRIGKHRYYGATGVLDPSSPLPSVESRRQRTLRLVRHAVAQLGREVRLPDVVDAAGAHAEFRAMEPALIIRDIGNLVRTGDLRVTGTVRADAGGGNLYLPADLDPAEYAAATPLTWLETVLAAVEELWAEELATAAWLTRQRDAAAPAGAAAGPILPNAIATGQVRARLGAAPCPHPNLAADERLLANALLQLARTERPKIRAVARAGERYQLWVPAHVPENGVTAEGVYANDAERLAAAVRRAEARLQEPAGPDEVAREIREDPRLQPDSRQPLPALLSDLAKETVDDGRGGRVARVAPRIVRVGRLDGAARYAADRVRDGVAHVEAEELLAREADAELGQRANALAATGLLPTVAYGRALLVLEEAAALSRGLRAVAASGLLRPDVRARADAALARVVAVEGDVRATLPDHHAAAGRAVLAARRAGDPTELLPAAVDPLVPGWSPAELLDVLRPVYPRARRIDDPSELTRLLFNAVRRVPNPAHTSKRSGDASTAPEALFDRTDARLYAAAQWGGAECAHQAAAAARHLDRLRDTRFVAPALRHRDLPRRLAAVACAAYLPAPETTAGLADLARHDPEPGVRQAALWAYGFAGGADAMALARALAASDADADVRAFAERALAPPGAAWWSV